MNQNAHRDFIFLHAIAEAFKKRVVIIKAGVNALDSAEHAAFVVLATAVAITLYRPLGFLITMTLLVFSLLVLVERRNVVRAAAYSVGLSVFAYWLFGIALKSPLERGLLWF